MELSIIKDLVAQIKPPDKDYWISNQVKAASTAQSVMAVRKLKAQLDAIEQQEVDRIRKVAGELRARLNEAESATMPLLATWYDAVPKKTKTIELCEGVEAYARKTRERLDILDKEKCVEYCKLKGIPINSRTVTTETPDKAALMRHLAATGELPEFCDYVASEEKFDLRDTGANTIKEVE